MPASRRQVHLQKIDVPRTVALIVCSLAFTLGSWGQNALFLSLSREGAATVIVDQDTRTGYILDGGQRGSLIDPAAIGDEDVLTYLHSKVDTIYIVCSHPHADHQAGLLELVRRMPEDGIALTSFKHVRFIDSDYPENSRLFAEYKAAHGAAAKNSEHYSATNRNAFADDSRIATSLAVTIENFEYSPDAKASVHGKSLITTYSLLGPKKEHWAEFVDFDDANTSLVDRWAAETKAAAALRYFVVPHHNSDLTNVHSLRLSKPTGIIFAVNPNNRFLHPGPGNWLKWIESDIGIRNIHVTGLGTPVSAGPEGIPPLSNEQLEQVRQKIIVPMFRRLELRASNLQTRTDLADPIRQGKLAAVNDLWKTLGTIDSHYRKESSGAALMFAKAGPNGASNRAKVNANDPRGPLAGSLMWNGGIGGFGDLDENFDEEYDKRVRRPVPHSPAGIRGSRFDVSSTDLPVFGGVIMGNQVTMAPGKTLLSARIDTERELELGEPTYTIKLYLNIDGKAAWYSYDEFTEEELMAAFRLAHPGEEELNKHKVNIQDCNLVGIAADPRKTENGWYFGIHPAIANTSLAIDSMHLDMLISTLESTLGTRPMYKIGSSSLLNADVQQSLRQIGGFDTYQWHDAPSIVDVVRGSIMVYARTMPEDILLRVRFYPGDSLTSSGEGAMNVALMRGLYSQVDYLRRLDRFAKLVAVVNLVADHEMLASVRLPDRLATRQRISVEPGLAYSVAAHRLGLEERRSILWTIAIWLTVTIVGILALRLIVRRMRNYA